MSNSSTESAKTGSPLEGHTQLLTIAPGHVLPLRGFITNGSISSRQIDILLFDSRKPSLFRDGDLVVSTPDSVVGVVEVKTTIRSTSELKGALEPLAENISMIRSGSENSDVFAGLFAFETPLGGRQHLRQILDCLAEVENGNPTRIIDMISIGRNTFILHWDGVPQGYEPSTPAKRRWHAYHLIDQAPGYFLSNIIYSVDPSSVGRNMSVWFPMEHAEFIGPLEQEDVGPGIVESGPKTDR